MEFRWVAIITLWTFLSGPILGVPSSSVSSARAGKASVKFVKAAGQQSPRR